MSRSAAASPSGVRFRSRRLATCHTRATCNCVRDRSHSLKLLFCQVLHRAHSFGRPLNTGAPIRRLAWAFLLLLASASFSLAPARADDLTDFDHARALYVKRNYAGAATALK